MQAPIPFSDGVRDTTTASASHDAGSLLDLLYDGFYMVFLLKNRQGPLDPADFRERIRGFLTAFERGSQRLQVPAEDVYESKFAFCALVDEIVLNSGHGLREAWGRRPLQLELFGEQLAGERFFDHLERARVAGAPKLQVLEVHHLCLLLGFQGKYFLEGSEKLGYLTARVGEEIAQLKGRRATFAPHGAAPDRAANRLRGEVPLWLVAGMFALAGGIAFLGIRATLQRQTQDDLAAYTDIVQLAPQVAYVTLTLP